VALSPGARLGPYEITSRLGAGGFGEVYKARDTRLDRTVAVKILPSTDPELRARFESEAKAIAALQHAHICTLYDVGHQDGTDYLALEYLEGETLADRLRRGAMKVPEAIPIAIDVADALDRAHRAGIVHRDLKPANIMLTKGGVKLLDFGLAKRRTAPVVAVSGVSAAATESTPVTAQGTILGTFQYMAPEQIEGQEADARTDIFAFGAVVYEMLTGKKAFEGKSQASVIGAIMHADPPPIEASQPLLSPAINHVVMRCLAKDRDERWQSAADVMRELRWALEPGSAVTTRVRQSRTWAWAAVAAVLIGVAGGWIAGHTRPRRPDERVMQFHIEPPVGGQFVFGATTGGIALSPDGKTVAYVASVDGKNALWVRPLDRAASRMLPGTEGAAFPFWSPDSRSIAFVAGNKLQRVDPAGGAPFPICANTAQIRGGAWSDDGWILFGSLSTGLFRVQASGGTPAPLTALDTSLREGIHGFPQMLGSDRFLYWARGGTPETTGIYVTSIGRPRDRVLLMTTEAKALYTSGEDGRHYLLWTRGASLLAQEFDADALKLAGDPVAIADPVGTSGVTGDMNVAASANGVLIFSASNVSSQFRWLDRTGKSLGTVGEVGNYHTFHLSPDGRRLITTRERPGGADLWLLELDRGGVATRLTARPGFTAWPSWSSDGQAMVFASGALNNLFRRQINGAEGSEQRLTQSPNPQQAMDWSRDGRWVLFYEITPGTGRDLGIVETTPNRTAPRPYLRTPSNEAWGRFSPESSPRYVAYQSDESGRYEIYVDTFPTPHSRTQISTSGGQFPVWGPGGRELFYVSNDFKLIAVSLTVRPESVEPSAPHELFWLPAVDTGRTPYDVTADGQRFLVRATPTSSAPPSLTMIVNWPALRKR
jgi:eukaryotic-like serine/threonine-protein kinase